MYWIWWPSLLHKWITSLKNRKRHFLYIMPTSFRMFCCSRRPISLQTSCYGFSYYNSSSSLSCTRSCSNKFPSWCRIAGRVVITDGSTPTRRSYSLLSGSSATSNYSNSRSKFSQHHLTDSSLCSPSFWIISKLVMSAFCRATSLQNSSKCFSSWSSKPFPSSTKSLPTHHSH